MKNLFCCNSVPVHLISTNLYMCHNNLPVLTCGSLSSYHFVVYYWDGSKMMKRTLLVAVFLEGFFYTHTHHTGRVVLWCIHDTRSKRVNSLWPSDAIWRHRSGSTLARVNACDAWQHQVITKTNVDFSSVRFSDNHLRAFSQEMPKPTLTKISLKIIL